MFVVDGVGVFDGKRWMEIIKIEKIKERVI